jgi:hypothetical protein
MSMRRCHASPFALALLAAALLLRMALPAGWMPVAGADGVRIEICSGEGLKTVMIDAEGRAHPDSPAPRDPCPYSLAAAIPLDPPMQAALPLPPAAVAALLLPAHTTARLLAWRASRPPARGPPSLA